MAFNNCNPETNGEKYFYNLLKDKITTIFDIGCRYDSLFLDFTGDVHYFDPISEFINKLKEQPTLNRKSYFNTFGLGYQTGKQYYFPAHQSFVNRIKSCHDDAKNKLELEIKTATDYITEFAHCTVNTGLETQCLGTDVNDGTPIDFHEFIDFIKIDTEGYELDVLQGFGDLLTTRVKVIQFEYGGTYLDKGIKLQDVISYLETQGFGKFCYLSCDTLIQITDFTDHYKYCNIVCVNMRLEMKDLY